MTNTTSIAAGPDVDPGPVPAVDPEQDWVFTFGHGQRAYARGTYDHETGRDPGGRGMNLMDRYVVIRGTSESSRARMFDLFGRCWSHQYANREDAGVNEFELTELVLTPADVEVVW